MQRMTLVLAVLVLSARLAAAQEHAGEHKEPRVELPKKAVCLLVPTKGNEVSGILTVTVRKGYLHIEGDVFNLEPGLHGFHIHEFGDITSADGAAAGGHFNPTGDKHGGPDDKHRHAGDLGNIEANDDGVAQVDIKVEGLELHFIIGRSLVVHAGPDDLKSQPAGDSGPRVAVGVIGIAKEEPAEEPKKLR